MTNSNQKLKATAIAAAGLVFYAISSNLISLAAVGIANLVRFGSFGLWAGALSPLGYTLVEISIIIVSFGGAALIISRGLPDTNFLERPVPGKTAIFFALFFAAIYLGSYLGAFSSSIFSHFGISWADVSLPDITGVASAVLTVLRFALLPAFFEELLFRGALLRRLLPLGELGACLSVAIIFTLFHFNAAQWPPIFLLGFVLTYAAIKTGSIVVPIIMHLFNNSLVLLQSYALHLGFDKILEASSLLIIALGIGGAVFFVSARRQIPGLGLAKGQNSLWRILASPLIIIVIFCVVSTALTAVKA